MMMERTLLKKLTKVESFQTLLFSPPKEARCYVRLSNDPDLTAEEAEGRRFLVTFAARDATLIETLDQMDNIETALNTLIKVANLPPKAHSKVEQFLDFTGLLRQNVNVLFLIRATDKGEVILIALPDRNSNISKTADNKEVKELVSFANQAVAVNLHQSDVFVMRPIVRVKYHKILIEW